MPRRYGSGMFFINSPMGEELKVFLEEIMSDKEVPERHRKEAADFMDILYNDLR